MHQHAHSISPDEAAQHVHDVGVTFIDVRPEEEYLEGHARGARNIPLSTIPDHITEFAQYRVVYVICRSGGRSMQAVHFLRTQGIPAVNIAGGLSAWEAAGLPVTT